MKEIGARLRDILTGRPGTLRVRARSVNAWRAVRDRMIVPAAKTSIIRSAYCYRAVLRNVVFTGVTGSCGKTTAKDLIAAVLSSQFEGRKTPANYNLPFDIAKTMLTVRPWD